MELQAIDGYFVFLPFPNKLSPSHQASCWWSCSPFQPCVGLQFCPWCPLTALWSCPWQWRGLNGRCWFYGEVFFYTHNKLKLIDGLEWCGVDYLWIIVMFLSAVWTLILMAPIHCIPLVSKWCNAKLIQICSDEEIKNYILDGLRVSTF